MWRFSCLCGTSISGMDAVGVRWALSIVGRGDTKLGRRICLVSTCLDTFLTSCRWVSIDGKYPCSPSLPRRFDRRLGCCDYLDDADGDGGTKRAGDA